MRTSQIQRYTSSRTGKHWEIQAPFRHAEHDAHPDVPGERAHGADVAVQPLLEVAIVDVLVDKYPEITSNSGLVGTTCTSKLPQEAMQVARREKEEGSASSMRERVLYRCAPSAQ
jgi:hypothetical protein